MRKAHIIILSVLLSGILLGGVLLLLRPNRSGGDGSEETTEKTVYIENAAELYAQAVEGLSERDLQLTVTENRSITINDLTYQAQRNYTIRLDRSDPDDQRYHLQDETVMGSHSIPWEEYRIGNERYLIISGLAFQDGSQPSGGTRLYINAHPTEALDHSRYGKITATEVENGYLVEFSDATSLESWLGKDHDNIEYIKATALLSKDKQLLSYAYATAYQEGNRRIEVVYEVTVEQPDITITLPEPAGGWQQLILSHEPMALEIAAGILVQAANISSQYHEEIYFEALGDRRVREISLQLDHKDSLTAAFTTTTTTTKDSRLDQPEITVKEECFADGKYTVGQNGSEGAFDPSIDESAMLRYLQNQLISTIMLPQYIADCQVETVDGNTRYIFTGNQAFAEFLCRNAGQQLYADPGLLIGETVSIKTDQLTCYLELSGDTGLPVASGISFAGSYEMQGLPYQFTYEVSQAYQFDTP